MRSFILSLLFCFFLSGVFGSTNFSWADHQCREGDQIMENDQSRANDQSRVGDQSRADDQSRNKKFNDSLMLKKRSLSEFHTEWQTIMKKGEEDYNSLTANERIWFNVQHLITDVDNGGVISYYAGQNGERNKETIEDLKSLGYADLANILTQINTWFPGGPAQDIDKRNETIDSWPEDRYDRLLEEYDHEFYLKEEGLQNQLIYIIDNKILSKQNNK